MKTTAMEDMVVAVEAVVDIAAVEDRPDPGNSEFSTALADRCARVCVCLCVCVCVRACVCVCVCLRIVV